MGRAIPAGPAEINRQERKIDDGFTAKYGLCLSGDGESGAALAQGGGVGTNAGATRGGGVSVRL